MGRDTAGRLIVKTREPFRCVPTDDGIVQEEFVPSAALRGSSTGVMAQVESLRGGWASPRGRWRGCLKVC